MFLKFAFHIKSSTFLILQLIVQSSDDVVGLLSPWRVEYWHIPFSTPDRSFSSELNLSLRDGEGRVETEASSCDEWSLKKHCRRRVSITTSKWVTGSRAQQLWDFRRSVVSISGLFFNCFVLLLGKEREKKRKCVITDVIYADVGNGGDTPEGRGRDAPGI